MRSNGRKESQGSSSLVAGLSGLIAAVRLAKPGADITVIDREDRVGGRIYSATLRGTQVNLGAQCFFKSDNDASTTTSGK